NMKLGARTKGKYDSRISDRSNQSCYHRIMKD
ncbi:uncharacterized protein METZ01_LOCUS258368, partial [marine metagenome]